MTVPTSKETQTRRGIRLAIVLSLGSATPLLAQSTIYVNVNAPLTSVEDGTTWANAYRYLQDALDDPSLAPGYEIWIANGKYRPSVPFCLDCDNPGDRHATFVIPSGVRIYGGFKGVDTLGNDPNDPNTGEMSLNERNEEHPDHWTVLTGDRGTEENILDDLYHIVTAVDVDENTKLSGVRIEYGNANGSDPNSPLDRVGGGVLIIGRRIEGIDRQSSLVLTRCHVEYCYAVQAGAGAFVAWTRVPDEPNDPNCIDDPTDAVELQPARFVNCQFRYNRISDPNDLAPSSSGAAISVRGAALKLTNNVIAENSGGDRTAGVEYVIGLDPNDLPVYSRGAVTNCSFNLNKSGYSTKEAIYAHMAPCLPLIVRHTICWGNGERTDQGPNLDPNLEVAGDIDARFCDIRYPYGSVFPSIDNSNINLDPLFCEAGDQLFPLGITNDSPCVDRGHDDYVPPDFADVDDNGNSTEVLPWDRLRMGRFRDATPSGEIVDMGAYEVDDRVECLEDINGDGQRNLTDLAILLTNFGLSPGECPGHSADINDDGEIDLTDLAILLTVYGTPCEGESMMAGNDPLTVWLRCASPEEVLAWWNAGMPPITGGNEQ